MNLETRREGDTNWESMVTRSILAGVETLSDRSLSRTVAGADLWTYTTSIKADHFRLGSVTAGGAAATDTLTVRVRASHTGG